MKKAVILLIALLLLISSVTIMAYAHSGGTDSSGGHYNHSTGEYHYHHGYPAHQHTGGRCPYDYHDNTDYSMSSSSKSSKSSSGSSNTYSSSSSEDDPIIAVPIISITVAYVIYMLLLYGIIDKLGDKVAYVFIGIGIVAVILSLICLNACPGAVLITAAVEGVICWVIWYIIDNHKYKRK